jgi:hypothetical protein
MKKWKVLPVTNTRTNEELASGLEEAMNQLEQDGFATGPDQVFRNGSHLVVCGHKKATRGKPSPPPPPTEGKRVR